LIDAEKFPRKLKASFAEDVLRKGVIIHKNVEFTNPPKPKFFIVVGIDFNSNEARVVLINSEKTEFARRHPEIGERHIEIHSRDYGFLDHKSYIDCSTVSPLELRKLLTDFVADISQYRGNLTAEHLNQVIQEINKAKTVTARDKKLVGCDWTPQEIKKLLDSL
jgi:hypothetical protein